MGLLKRTLTGKAVAGQGALLNAADELQAEEFVQVLKVHRCLSPMGFISFDNTKIRRKISFMQWIFLDLFSNVALFVTKEDCG